MLRGIVAALALTAALAPATDAAASPYEVFEVVRVRPGGPAVVHLTGRSRTKGSFVAHGILRLRRGDDGWAASQAVLSMISGLGEYRAYGWPVAAPGCPALCSTWSGETGLTTVVRVTPRADERYLLAGPRGAFTATVDSAHWAVRKPHGSGFRVLHATQADATGLQWQGQTAEHFRSATAPGGRYGSVAFAEPPCDDGVGSAALTLDDAPKDEVTCLPRLGGWGFGDANEGGRWRLAGHAVGSYFSTARLVVFDYPAPR